MEHKEIETKNFLLQPWIEVDDLLYRELEKNAKERGQSITDYVSYLVGL